MNRQTVGVLLRHEFTMLLRDRRAVVLAVVLPLATMPLILFATTTVQDRRERQLRETVYRYAVTGSEQEQLRDTIRRAKEMRKQPAGKEAEPEFRFEELRVRDPEASLRTNAIHFYLEALSGTEADARARTDRNKRAEPSAGGQRKRGALAAEPERLRGVSLVRILYQGDRDESEAGVRRMRNLLVEQRRAARGGLLKERGFELDPGGLFPVSDRKLAMRGQVTGSYVGRFLTLFLLLLMLSGGSVVAMDIIAGEKERGSLETLLTTAATRGEIVAAKQLAILSVALGITVIQAANILVYVTLEVIPLPGDFVVEAPPAMILTLLLLFVPLAALVSAVLLLLSTYAKSYKEAQLYFFPVYLLSIVPSLASVLPGIQLRSAIVLVPVANVSVAVREILVGKYDWPMLLLSFAVMCAASLWAVRASAAMLSSERLITSSEGEFADWAGGPAVFPKHVLRWYAILGVLLFVVAANFPSLATFRRQLLFNELILFLAGPLLMIRLYRLNLRDALALRGVRAAVWPAVLLIIPSGHIVSIGVFQLANLVFPVPKEVLEQFSRELLPRDMGVRELLFFIAVLPGICEEIAFRGTLLYGLRRRFGPVQLAVVVGLIFGLFHVALFRIVPTAFMGVFLTALALLTGSIFPGMVVHIGNNALAFVADRKGYPVTALPWWAYAAAALVFGACFYVLYRNRTPYPGTRWSASGGRSRLETG